MKAKLSFLFLFMAFSTISGTCQKVVEQLISTQKSFSPLFGSESGTLSVLFAMEYDLKVKDTTLFVVFEVNNAKSENQGGAVSVGVLGRNLAGASSSFYSIKRTNGSAIFDYNKFDTLYRYCNELADYTKRNYGRNRIIMYEMGNIKISMEIAYRGGEDPTTAYDRFYYLSIDDATYRLKQNQFIDLTTNTINEIKKSWDEYNKTKLLPIFKY